MIILDSEDYFEKLDKIVLDKSKFKEVNTENRKAHPIISKENSITRFLIAKLKPFIAEKVFQTIHPSGSQPGNIYGLCKVHKQDNPLRPVVSMINTAEYQSAKYLENIIKPCIPNKYMLNSTADFLNRIKDFIFKPSQVLVRYDVVSLFTNIPLKQTIDITCDYVYSKDNHPNYPKQTFKRLLEMATGGYFLYRDKLYCQTDGITMGRPLGPTLANMFLAHFEIDFMSEPKKLPFSPKLYLRYVDDIFCVFDNQTNVLLFLDFLNKLQPSHSKFTHDIGPNHLPFLDTEISLPVDGDSTFSSDVYRKPTNTNVILNFAAIRPE